MKTPGALDDFAASVLATGVTPAAAVAVTDRDGLLYAATYGDAAPDGLWNLGSIGKSFTAILALQLAAEGRLDLHAPVTDVLPWWRVQTNHGPITPHHLLTHTAGLVQGPEIGSGSNYDVIALAELPNGPVGSPFWYSNVGYRTLGVMISHVAGRPYPELVAERIFEPAGMRRSQAAITNDIRREMVQGYDAPYDDRPWRPEQGLVPAAWVESAESDGCISTPLEDFAAYARMLLRRGEGVLDPDSFELMTTAYSHDHEDDDDYGYGLALTGTRYGHGGGVIGMHTKLWCEPGSGLAVVTAVNGLDGSGALADAALAIARGDEPETFVVEHGEPLVDDGSAEPRLAALCGVYRSHNPWQTCIRVAAREGGLVLAWDGGYSERYPLTEMPDGSFRYGEDWSPERLSFDTEIDGRPQRAVMSGCPLYRRFSP